MEFQFAGSGVKCEPGDGDGLQGSALNKLKAGDIDESKNL